LQDIQRQAKEIEAAEESEDVTHPEE